MGGVINNSSVVIRKDFFEKAGGFSENKKLISCEDFELWLRVAKLTEKFFYLQKCLGFYSISQDSICNKKRKFVNNLELKKIYKKSFAHKKKPFWMIKNSLQHIASRNKFKFFLKSFIYIQG